MKNKKKKLSESEHEVMELLWNTQKPMTSSEIVEASQGNSWKPSYIHLLLNSLLKKEMIQVVGFTRTTKNYARTFEPLMTREEYTLTIMEQETAEVNKSLSKLFVALVEKETDMDVIEELSQMLEKRKQELKEKQ